MPKDTTKKCSAGSDLTEHCSGCTDSRSEGTHQGCTIEHGHVGCSFTKQVAVQVDIQDKYSDTIEGVIETFFLTIWGLAPLGSLKYKKGKDIEDFLRTALTAQKEAVGRETKEYKERLAEVLDALEDMYNQYCNDGHGFMSAGEHAMTVLERETSTTFDEVGRASFSAITHNKKMI